MFLRSKGRDSTRKKWETESLPIFFPIYHFSAIAERLSQRLSCEA